jgi:hypothetical protein
LHTDPRTGRSLFREREDCDKILEELEVSYRRVIIMDHKEERVTCISTEIPTAVPLSS